MCDTSDGWLNPMGHEEWLTSFEKLKNETQWNDWVLRSPLNCRHKLMLSHAAIITNACSKPHLFLRTVKDAFPEMTSFNMPPSVKAMQLSSFLKEQLKRLLRNEKSKIGVDFWSACSKTKDIRLGRQIVSALVKGTTKTIEFYRSMSPWEAIAAGQLSRLLEMVGVSIADINALSPSQKTALTNEAARQAGSYTNGHAGNESQARYYLTQDRYPVLLKFEVSLEVLQQISPNDGFQVGTFNKDGDVGYKQLVVWCCKDAEGNETGWKSEEKGVCSLYLGVLKVSKADFFQHRCTSVKLKFVHPNHVAKIREELLSIISKHS